MNTEFSSTDRSLIIPWVILVALIIGSLEAATAAIPGFGSEARSATVLVLAFVKIWIVAWYFMQLRFAARWLRVAVGCWIVIVCAVLVAMSLN